MQGEEVAGPPPAQRARSRPEIDFQGTKSAERKKRFAAAAERSRTGAKTTQFAGFSLGLFRPQRDEMVAGWNRRGSYRTVRESRLTMRCAVTCCARCSGR